ncbi:MAG: aminotransferase class V-fold PLP-dependent enzyme [Candidatus Thorarchaeota archaeon]
MPPSIDPEFISEMFPTLSEMTYLNNAATGIPPITVIDAIKEYLGNKIHAKGKFDETLDALGNIRENLGKLLGGTSSEFGLVPNTSLGINMIANGIDYPKGSNIVICDLEFPANYVPWQNISRLNGIDLRVVKSKNGAVPLEKFREQIDEYTRVVAVSLTQFASGYRSDVKALADDVHKSGGYLVADIIQAAGWLDIDLHNMGVDFAAAQSAKWLIGPIGSGFIYVNEKNLDSLVPKFLGWWGVKEMDNFSYFERDQYSDARKFEVGSPSMLSNIGFLKSLELLLSIPADVRESVALGNADYLRKRLGELDIEFYDFDERNKSPIVSCTPPNVEEVHKKFQSEKIYCSVRNGRLRVSPHFYNTHEEIDRLLEVLR